MTPQLVFEQNLRIGHVRLNTERELRRHSRSFVTSFLLRQFLMAVDPI